MNFIEALKLLKEGKYIRRSDWDKTTYISEKNGRLLYITPGIYDMLQEDWEIYVKVKRIETYSFQKALEAFNEGKNIKSIDRTYWFNRKHDYEYEEIFTLKDVNATDWIIEEGD